MDVIELIPGLHFLRFPVGHAYLCEDPDGLALIDTSVPGSAPQIAAAIGTPGHDPASLRWLLLTHFHADHAGSAAEIAAWGGAEVCAHHTDAPFLRGEAPGPPPDLAGWERPLFDQVSRQPRSRPRCGSTANSATVTSSASAAAPSRSPYPGTPRAASRSTFPGGVSCSLARGGDLASIDDDLDERLSTLGLLRAQASAALAAARGDLEEARDQLTGGRRQLAAAQAKAVHNRATAAITRQGRRDQRRSRRHRRRGRTHPRMPDAHHDLRGDHPGRRRGGQAAMAGPGLDRGRPARPRRDLRICLNPDPPRRRPAPPRPLDHWHQCRRMITASPAHRMAEAFRLLGTSQWLIRALHAGAKSPL